MKVIDMWYYIRNITGILYSQDRKFCNLKSLTTSASIDTLKIPTETIAEHQFHIKLGGILGTPPKAPYYSGRSSEIWKQVFENASAERSPSEFFIFLFLCRSGHAICGDRYIPLNIGHFYIPWTVLKGARI